MTIQEFATMLDGRQYLEEISPAEIVKAKELGYIVVCGQSDDLCEIYGAFREEYDCFNGGVIEDERLPKPITAVWCDKDRGCAWSYKTDMPYAEFNIFEDDELYCVGIVVDLGEVLKPCPFCGGDPVINEIPPHTHVIATFMPDCKGECFIECKCSCAITAENKKKAIEKWNRRVKNE